MIKSRRNIDYFFSKAFFIRIAWMPERSLKIVCWCEGMQDLAILKMRHFYCNINSIRFMKILSTNCFVENRHVARGDEKSANHLSFWKNFVEKLKVYWKKILTIQRNAKGKNRWKWNSDMSNLLLNSSFLSDIILQCKIFKKINWTKTHC